MATCHEWIDDAESDLLAARRLLDPACTRHACFLAQQAAEKALKALLLKTQGAVPRTHDLKALADRVRVLDPTLPDRTLEVASLNPHYTIARYPDARAPNTAAPTVDEATAAVRFAELLVGDGRQRIA